MKHRDFWFALTIATSFGCGTESLECTINEETRTITCGDAELAMPDAIEAEPLAYWACGNRQILHSYSDENREYSYMPKSLFVYEFPDYFFIYCLTERRERNVGSKKETKRELMRTYWQTKRHAEEIRCTADTMTHLFNSKKETIVYHRKGEESTILGTGYCRRYYEL
jgi:hypothetical protein